MVELMYLKIRENIKKLKYGTILEVHRCPGKENGCSAQDLARIRSCRAEE